MCNINIKKNSTRKWAEICLKNYILSIILCFKYRIVRKIAGYDENSYCFQVSYKLDICILITNFSRKSIVSADKMRTNFMWWKQIKDFAQKYIRLRAKFRVLWKILKTKCTNSPKSNCERSYQYLSDLWFIEMWNNRPLCKHIICWIQIFTNRFPSSAARWYGGNMEYISLLV